MGASLNKVQLIGRLGRDPEVRYTSGGAAVANFTLATDETYKDRSGEKQQKTEWHNIVVWGPAVESYVSQYLHKGDLVYVEGKLQTRQWEDKRDGSKRTTTEVVVFDIKGMNTARTTEEAPARSSNTRPAGARPAQTTQRAAARPATVAVANPEESQATEIDDEDIPF